MSQRNRRRFDSNFKTKVVIEALKERKTISALTKEFRVHPQQITDWKRQAMDTMPEMFGRETYTTGHFCFTQRRHARNTLVITGNRYRIVANFVALRGKCPVV
jgi:transposase-like protein